MSVVWHIMRKDFQRLRWLLLLWAVLQAGYLGLAEVQFRMDVEAAEVFRWSAWVCGAIFLPVTVFGLVMALQGDDAVCDVDAFWVTRPIPAGTLFVAKCCSLVLYWMLPVAVTLPWWVLQGYGFGEIAAAAGQIFRQQALLTLLAAPVALVSANSRRFLMQGLLLAACLALPLVVYGLIVSAKRPGGIFWGGETTRPVHLAWLIWVVAAAIVAVIQYRYRQRGKSIYLLAAAALGVSTVLAWGRMGGPAPAPAVAAPPESAAWQLMAENHAMQVRGEGLQYFATVAGETRPLDVLVSLPAEVDRRAAGNGRVIRVEYFSLAGTLTIPLSESEPAWWAAASVAPAKPAYLLVNSRDGRVMRAQVARGKDLLEVATVRYFRTTLTFPLAELGRAGIPPAELAVWMQTARVLKVASPVAALPAGTDSSR